MNQFSRSELIFGAEGTRRLAEARVAVFGVGGVGGYAVEALARGGVGALDLVDSDIISLTNLNRQIVALHSTIGRYKVEVAKERALDINPDITINTYNMFYLPETAYEVDLTKYDYIIDAIDTVTGKLELITRANKADTPIISSMGAGNKLNSTAFEVSDIYKTTICPLAKVLRKELRKRAVPALKVVYSKEEPIIPHEGSETPAEGRRQIPGSTSFVPPVVGLIIAGEVIKDLCRT